MRLELNKRESDKRLRPRASQAEISYTNEQFVKSNNNPSKVKDLLLLFKE